MTSRSSCTAKALHVVQSLSRRQPAGEAEEERGVPGRHLTALDLVGLGVGSTLGAGISVVTGEVARQLAGPSIAVSYLAAAAAAILSGLCYAELVARVPRAGSAYLYCYVALGEAWAFITAWNLLLAYSSGTSCLARAWSGTLDDLIHNLMGSTLGEHVAMDLPGLAPHPHFLSAVLILFLAGVLAFGVKLSVVLNTVLTSVTIVVLFFIIIAGCVKGSISNWHINLENLTSLSNQTVDYGNGGFFPFGWEGTLAGAASCFYAFIGFDCIAAKVEEVQDPQRAVPLGILGSLLVCFLAYFGVSCALTLLVPYPLLDLYSPLPRAFSHMGWHTATYLVALSALCALLTSLLGVLYPMPQVLCAMARDGLLFKALGRVSSKQSPFVATLAMGSVAAFMALLLDLKVLIEVSSMGTLFAYTLVAVCILTLRYKEDSNFVHRPEPFAMMRLLRPPSEPTARTAKDVKILTVIIIFLVVALSVLLSRATASLGRHEIWSLLLVSVLLAMLALSVAVVWRQPENTAAAAFKVPCLPVLPILSVFINVYLLVQVRAEAWVVYAVWMVLGIVLYLSYGLQHSLLGLRLKQERNQVDIESVSNRNVVDSAG